MTHTASQTSLFSHPKYRPDIDGLRALAVLSVVIFHAFPSAMRGGFIGVDVFFIISGYLISTIIFKNLDQGTFSFAEFYARRIKRIFPALFLVLAASFTVGWFVLLADEYKQLGKHIAAGAGYVANIVLQQEAGYFDNAAETKPLLHLWSLGIEEQFYIFWPLVLWVAWKRKFNLFVMTALGTVASFALNIKGVQADAVATFYSPQTRFWELLCGSILAWLTLYKSDLFRSFKIKLDGWLVSVLYQGKRSIDGKTFSNVLSFVGLLLLAWGFWEINRKLNFPGTWALLPVCGALFIICAGPQAWMNRVVLSHKVAVWFGLISFPLYLWHWPLLAFVRIVEGEVPLVSIRFGIVALSVLLAWMTYFFLEKYMRSAKHTTAKIAILLGAMFLMGSVGYYTYSQDGFVSRFDTLAPGYKAQIVKVANAWKFRDYPVPNGSYKDPKYGALRIGHNADKVILFVGDSHMKQYWNTISKSYHQEGNTTVEKPSVVFIETYLPSVFNSDLLSDKSIKTVIFSYYWSYKYGSDKVNQAVRCCGPGKNGGVGANTKPFLNAKQMDILDKTTLEAVQSLKAHGKDVYFILDNPFGEELDPHAMLDRSWRGVAVNPPPKLSREAALKRAEPVRTRLLKIAQATGAKIIDPFEALCDAHYCSAFSSEGELLYKDYDHISMFSSENKIPYLNFIYK